MNIHKNIIYILIVSVFIFCLISVAGTIYAAQFTDKQLSSYIKSRLPNTEPSGWSRGDLEAIAKQELKKEGYSDQEISAMFITGNSLPLKPAKPTSGSNSGFVPLQEDFFNDIGVDPQSKDISLFFNSVFKFGIYIAGFLATIMIIYGGIIYMSTDAIDDKKEGKEIITAALTGLLLILFSWILLNQINPDLLKLKI